MTTSKKRERCKDLVGLTVVLTRSITGVAAGTCVRVTGTHRGMFTLSRLDARDTFDKITSVAPREAFEVVEIPACGFREQPDGTIAWGSAWKPGPYADPEPVLIEYDQLQCGAWVPRQAWVRDGDHLRLYDCDWVPSEGSLYYSYAGGGTPYISRYGTPDALPGGVWIAEGTTVFDDGWDNKRPLSDADLAGLGHKRVHGSTPAPFADAVEGQTHYCEPCGERVPEDDTTQCCICESLTHVHVGSLCVVIDEDEAGLDLSLIHI